VPVSQCRLPAIAIATSFRGSGTSNRAKRLGKVLKFADQASKTRRPLFLGGWTAKRRHAATSIPFNDDDEQPAYSWLVVSGAAA